MSYAKMRKYNRATAYRNNAEGVCIFGIVTFGEDKKSGLVSLTRLQAEKLVQDLQTLLDK